MKTTKKVLALLLCAVLLVSATVAGTVAWLTAKDSVKNTFAVGNVNVKLSETVKVTDYKGNELEGKVVKTEDGATFANILPGNKIQKEIVVENTGNTAAYVRVELTVNNHDAMHTAFRAPYVAADKSDLSEKIADVFVGWNAKDYDELNKSAIVDGTTVLALDRAVKIPINGYNEAYYAFDLDNMMQDPDKDLDANDGYIHESKPEIVNAYYWNAMDADSVVYTFYLKLAPKGQTGSTYTLINGINCPEYFDNTQIKMFEGLEINARAYAIQAEGFADANAAFAKLAEDLPIGYTG